MASRRSAMVGADSHIERLSPPRSEATNPRLLVFFFIRLLAVAFVFSLSSLLSTGASPVGDYLDPLIPDNVLEIDSDGSYYIEVFGLNIGETGRWTSTGNQVSLRFSDGTTLRGTFDPNSVVFDPIPMLTIAWIRSTARYPAETDVVGEFTKETRPAETIWIDPDGTYTKRERDMLGQMAEEEGRWQLDGHLVRLVSSNTLFDTETEAVFAGGCLFLPDFLTMSKWVPTTPIAPQPERRIRITRPSAGEILTGGTSYRYYWETTGLDSGLSEMFTVELSTDAGATWTAFAGVSNDGSDPWQVPNVNSDRCRLRMTSRSYPSVSGESETFSIGRPDAAPHGSISGTVVDARTQEPIAGAVIRLEPETGLGDLVSSSEGTFSAAVKPGKYVVAVSATGYEQAMTDVRVTSGQVARVRLAAVIAASWRRNLQKGDILYDPCALNIAPFLNRFGFRDTQLGHIGIYVGDNETVDPGLDSIRHPLSSWDSLDQVSILRVRCPDSNPDCREDAADWALALADRVGSLYSYQWPVIDAIFSGNHQKSPDPDETEWYCSELVWAAYFNQGIDVEAFPGNLLSETQSLLGRTFMSWTPVSPDEICEDEDTWQVGGYVKGGATPSGQDCGCAASSAIRAYCPVDLEVTGPGGRVIGRERSEWPGASYWVDDFNGDGSLDTEVTIPRESGDYEVRVVPWATAKPDDTFTLEYEVAGTAQPLTLAQNQAIGEDKAVRAYGFRIQSSYATSATNGDLTAVPSEASGRDLPTTSTFPTLSLRRVLAIPGALIVAALLAVLLIALRTRRRD